MECMCTVPYLLIIINNHEIYRQPCLMIFTIIAYYQIGRREYINLYDKKEVAKQSPQRFY